MSFYMVGHFVLGDLIISFCLDAMYWDDWAFASLLVNVLDVSIKKQMSNGNTMLTGSGCFPDLPWPLSTDAKGAKGADVGDDCIGGANVRGICTRGVCTKGTCTRGACIRNTCLRGACVGVVFVGGVCTSNIYARDTYAGNALSAVGACIKGAGLESICGLAHKPSKSSIEGLRLLVESISEIFISFCLCLQMILNSFS